MIKNLNNIFKLEHNYPPKIIEVVAQANWIQFSLGIYLVSRTIWTNYQGIRSIKGLAKNKKKIKSFPNGWIQWKFKFKYQVAWRLNSNFMDCYFYWVLLKRKELLKCVIDQPAPDGQINCTRWFQYHLYFLFTYIYSVNEVIIPWGSSEWRFSRALCAENSIGAGSRWLIVYTFFIRDETHSTSLKNINLTYNCSVCFNTSNN